MWCENLYWLSCDTFRPKDKCLDSPMEHNLIECSWSYLRYVGYDFVGDPEWRYVGGMTHSPTYHVCDGVAFVYVEADPFPQHQVHSSWIRKPNHSFDNQVGAVFICNSKCYFYQVIKKKSVFYILCAATVGNIKIGYILGLKLSIVICQSLPIPAQCSLFGSDLRRQRWAQPRKIGN